MKTLIAELIARYRSGAACAAALGISRQAFNAALHRGTLAPASALHAAELLKLASSTPAPYHPTPPILNPSPHALYYVKSQTVAKAPDLNSNQSKNDNRKYNAGLQNNVHFITSEETRKAIDVIRWVYSVAKLPADSPRFVRYVSRWLVPEKIAAAKLAGTFEETVKTCPQINPAWIRLVPAALAEYESFKALYFTVPARRISSTQPAQQRKAKPRAA